MHFKLWIKVDIDIDIDNNKIETIIFLVLGGFMYKMHFSVAY